MNSNELKWRLESHEQYWWTNDAKMDSNEDLNPMSNMNGQMIPKWTQMKTWIPWAIWMDKWFQNLLKWWHLNPMRAIWMDKWCQNELKWNQMKIWISWAIWMDKWCKNELKWRLESHEQYGWINDAKMNSKEDSNPSEQYGWTNDAKMNSNEDLNPMRQYGWTNDAKINSIHEDLNTMSNMDGQMMPKWTQMKTWIPWEIWDGQMRPKWTQMKTYEFHEHYGWTNDVKINSNELK